MKILFQQDEFFVLQKPSGVSVHNEPGYDIISLFTTHFSSPVYAIHRLDRPTSGVLLCTTHVRMVPVLQKALQNSMKQYRAVVRGNLSVQSGHWKYPISDKSEGRRNPQGKKQHRKSAHTAYEVLLDNQYFSVLSLTLHTGRQHQIRKHCVLAGHEIVGDTRYGDVRYQKNMKDRYNHNTLFLHAERLRFTAFGKEYDFTCKPVKWNVLGISGL